MSPHLGRSRPRAASGDRGDTAVPTNRPHKRSRTRRCDHHRPTAAKLQSSGTLNESKHSVPTPSHLDAEHRGDLSKRPPQPSGSDALLPPPTSVSFRPPDDPTVAKATRRLAPMSPPTPNPARVRARLGVATFARQPRSSSSATSPTQSASPAPSRRCLRSGLGSHDPRPARGAVDHDHSTSTPPVAFTDAPTRNVSGHQHPLARTASPVHCTGSSSPTNAKRRKA